MLNFAGYILNYLNNIDMTFDYQSPLVEIVEMTGTGVLCFSVDSDMEKVQREEFEW